jgi:hypothetical protein
VAESREEIVGGPSGESPIPLTDMKWYRGFAFHLRLLRQFLLLSSNVQPTPLQGEIPDSTLPAHNRNPSKAKYRNGERKRGNVGLHDRRPSDAFGLGRTASVRRAARRERTLRQRVLCARCASGRAGIVCRARHSSAALAASPSAGRG